MNAFAIKLFHHNVEGKYYSAEVSDLRSNVGFRTVGERFMLRIKSDTGNVAEFELAKQQMSNDEDYELLYTEYWPTRETVAKFPKLAGYTVTIFND